MKNRESRAALLFLAPAIVILSVFFFAPVVAGFALSVTDFDLYTLGDVHNLRFVALRNYRELVTNPIFSKLTRWKALFRAVYFAPVVTTLVAVSVVFKYLYHPRFGIINLALGALHLPQPDWLGDPHFAMPAIILLSVWKGFGYTMIIFIAGLQNIPEELYEAARLDGAGAWGQFRHVTLPMLGPTFLFVGIVVAIGQLQIFAEPYVMTGGGPLNKTLTIVMMMYQQGFKFWRMGYAAAVAFILFLVIGAATLLQMRLGEKR
jgi:multiple sugar transport system permease protein